VIRAARRALADAVSLIAPARCAGCGVICDAPFCAECLPLIQPVNPPLCLACGREMSVGASCNRAECPVCAKAGFRFDECRSATKYTGPLERAVVRFKYHRVRHLGAALAQLMVRYTQERPELFASYREADFVTPVPLHWMRRAWRRFNQSEILAAPVAAALDLPVEHALRRTRNNRPQARLGYKERRANVKGIFAPNPAVRLKGRRVVLIDDIITSGSTVSECAATLKKHGAKKVLVYTVCRRDPCP